MHLKNCLQCRHKLNFDVDKNVRISGAKKEQTDHDNRNDRE